MLLSQRAREKYISRKFRSFTWMKDLSEKDLKEALSKERLRPRFKTAPWLHQLVCFYIGLCEPRFLFLLDMGAGKSKILMDLLTHHIRTKRAQRGLVVVPRLINIGSWQEDVERHSDLKVCMVSMESIEEKWKALSTSDADLLLIDYQGLTLALSKKKKGGGLSLDQKKVQQLAKRLDFVGVDEIHKVKNHQSLWFRTVDSLASKVTFCYGTTGTLFGKDPEDLWSQFHLVDHGDTFGDNLGLFRATFYSTKPHPWKREERTFIKSTAPLLNRMIQNYSIRYNEREFSTVPEPIFVRRNLPLTNDQREAILQALDGFLGCGDDLQEMDSQWFRMRQIAAGYMGWSDEYGDHVKPFKETPKIDLLESILEDAGDSKVVISYEYTDTARLIISKLLEPHKIGYRWLWSGTKDPIQARKDFLTKEDVRVFLMNSESGGTGVDGLQKVSRYLVLFESPSSPITRKQVIKRIHRPGQEERAYVYDLVAKGTPDVTILESVSEGIDVHDSVVDQNSRKAIALKLKKLVAEG